MVLKDPCPKCNGTGAKPGTSPEKCPKCGGKGQVVYTQQSFFGMVQNVQTCPDCNGTGKIIRDKCPDCGGTGFTSNRKKIAVTIPAGIDNGQSVRIREKGEPGVNGGPRGDLLVEVVVSRHPIFQRQDMHIFSTVPISFAPGGSWCGDPGQDGRRRSSLYGEAGNEDGYQGASERQGSSVSAQFPGAGGSLCNAGNPDTGSSESRGERSA